MVKIGWQPGYNYHFIFDTNFFISLRKIYRKNTETILSDVIQHLVKAGYQVGTTDLVLHELKEAQLRKLIRKKMRIVTANPRDIEIVMRNITQYSGRRYTKDDKKTDYELIALSRQGSNLIVTDDYCIRSDKFSREGRVMETSTFSLELFNSTAIGLFKTLSRDFFSYRLKYIFEGDQFGSVFSDYVEYLYESIKPGKTDKPSYEVQIVDEIIEGKYEDLSSTTSTGYPKGINPELVKLAVELNNGIEDNNIFFEKVRLSGITQGTHSILSHIKIDLIEQAKQNWYKPVIALDCYNNLASIFSYEEDRKALKRVYVLRAIILIVLGRIIEARNLMRLIKKKDHMAKKLINVLEFLDDKEVKTIDGFQDFSKLFTTFKKWNIVKKLTGNMLLNGEINEETKEMYRLAISMRLEEPLGELRQLINYRDHTKKDMPFKSKMPILIEETQYAFLHEVMPLIDYYDDLEQGKRIIIVRCPKLSANLGIFFEDKSIKLNQMESLQFLTGHIKISSYVGPLRIRGKIIVQDDTEIDWHESTIQLPNLS